MGCCCSSRRAESNRRPHYIYCPRVVEIEPLSSTSGASSVVAAGLLVETNLEASILDTFRAPPTPLPYDVGIAGSQTLPGSLQNHGNKTDHMNLADSQPLDEADGRFESSALEKSDCKTKTDCWLESTKLTEDEPSKVIKPIASVVDEEDVCPTCLEADPRADWLDNSPGRPEGSLGCPECWQAGRTRSKFARALDRFACAPRGWGQRPGPVGLSPRWVRKPMFISVYLDEDQVNTKAYEREKGRREEERKKRKEEEKKKMSFSGHLSRFLGSSLGSSTRLLR